MKKILFVAEAVSLAHVARPSILAGALDLEDYELVFASNGQFPLCTADMKCERYRLDSISSETFMQRLAAGRPVYTAGELGAYVEADLQMLKAVQPDAVVGDFRLSLGIAARLMGIPLFSICNAYWSPFAVEARMQAPDLPIARLLGFAIFDHMFRLTWPLASRYHCTAINKVRKNYGLNPVRSLRDYYCDGDVVLYSDAASITPTVGLPANHHYIGPVAWSPAMALPAWWAEALAQPRKRAYITLGSTGNVDLLPAIVDACLAEGLVCLVATAGRSDFQPTSPHVFTSPFLPGGAVAEAADLVIGNGGSPGAQQALQVGTPVLGICSNLDQVMNMGAVQRANAGSFMRAGEFTSAKCRQAISALLNEPGYLAGAEHVQNEYLKLDASKLFPGLVKQTLG